MSVITSHPSSYRDPSGYIFEKEGLLYRQVNQCFKEDFESFISSGCFAHFVKKGLLIPHEQIAENLTGDQEWYTTLKPTKVSFISYAWEWSFDMLKDAALLTLQIAREALQFDMILKDATPYNIQWHKGKFILIDSLSFEKYKNQPWVAYRQFCEGFLAPLLLMHYRKYSLQQLQLAWPDGVPLDLTQRLLPWRSKLSIHTYLHIHLHAKLSRKENKPGKAPIFDKQKILKLFASLETLISSLHLPEQASTWSGYYTEASQRNDYLHEKKEIIFKWISVTEGVKSAVDIGANEGEFSKLLAAKSISTIAADFDPYCINRLYSKIKGTKEINIQPLILDIANPGPAIGVNLEERQSFYQRCRVDMVLALALIHHLVIGKRIPLEKVARMFSTIGDCLIVEFVPYEDEKVQLMLQTKTGNFPYYSQQDFENAFARYFYIEKKESIGKSGRTLFLMKGNK